MPKDYDELFNSFIDEYGQYYEPYVLDRMIRGYEKSKKDESGKPNNLYTASNELLQIYSMAGFYTSKQEDFFYKHFSKLKLNFDIGCNILEIGGGPLAVFSNCIALEQLKIGKGTVTVYDPRLITQSLKHPNITPYKENFTSDIDVSKFDLIVGIYPCKGTELLIETACKNRKDFYTALCGCWHFPTNSYYLYSDEGPTYQEYVCQDARVLVKKYNTGILIEDKLNDGIHRYPILYNKRF